MNKIKIRGTITIEIIDVKTKKLLKSIEVYNQIVTNGFKMFRNWSAGITPLADDTYNVDSRITDFAVGDDDSATGVSQTALGNELLRKEVFPTPDAGCSINLIDDQTVEYVILIDETELNGETIEEMGLFSTNQANPFMVSRFLTGSLSKTAAIQFVIKYKYKFEN